MWLERRRRDGGQTLWWGADSGERRCKRNVESKRRGRQVVQVWWRQWELGSVQEQAYW